MSNKKGFTLIEILAVIIIIGIVAIIAVPSITKYINGSKDTIYISYEKTMVDAARNMVSDCVINNEDCELPKNEGKKIVILKSLELDGFLDNMKDPVTKDFCEADYSYVEIKGSTPTDYNYKACLFCGDYFTDDVDCTELKTDGDNDKPVCGVVSGESTRWTNQNRTISVGCSDLTSGCEQSVFSKTFSKTTKNGIGKILIRDKSGATTECSVNAYVDKNPATCDITVLTDPNKTGEFIESTGWYSLKATAAIQNQKDGEEESGLLTYGMGTSLANRDYNKKNELEVGKGITTVIGYTKDIAGNEGICGKEIKVGTEIPKFNLYYGFIIFPNKEPITANGLTVNGNSITTTTTSPKLTIASTGEYKLIEKVKITLNSAIETETTATLKATGLTKTAPMAQGSKEIVFVLTGNQIKSYDSLEIQFGTINGKTYNINKIEILTKDGNTWTNKDVTMYVEPIDDGMRTTQVSFENGEPSTWINIFSKGFTSKTTNSVKTKNGIGMISEPKPFSIMIDKVVPTSSMTAKRKSNGNAVASGAYSNEGLNFTFNKGTVGESGSKLYYCKDTNNTCTPNIEVANGGTITDFNSITTNYYIRYRAISNSEEAEPIKSYNAKFDLVKPSCSFENVTTINVTKTKTLDLVCTDDLSGLKDITLSSSNFTLSNNNMSIENVTRSNVTNGYKYRITLKGIDHGSSVISLKANQIFDNSLNGNDVVSKDVSINGLFTISLDNQSANSQGTATIYELYNRGWYSNSSATTSITSITKPDKTGNIFGGYYTGTNGSGTKIIDNNGNIVAGNKTFTNNTTLYANWSLNSYVLTYDNQGGSGCTSKIGYYGNIWSTLCTPTRQDYDFVGWYTGTNGSGTKITSNSIVSGNLTVYAYWQVSKTNAVIKCNNTYYNEGVQIIASCSGGTISNASQKNVGEYTITCSGDANHLDAESKTCSILASIATNTVNGVTTGYPSLQQAVDASPTGVSKLLVDTSEYVTVSSSTNKTINLNAKTVTGTITNNGTVTINGNGKVVSPSYAIVNNNNMTITNGTFESTYNHQLISALYNSDSAQNLYVNGGTLSGATGIFISGIGNKVSVKNVELEYSSRMRIGIWVGTNANVSESSLQKVYFENVTLSGNDYLIFNAWQYPIFMYNCHFINGGQNDGRVYGPVDLIGIFVPEYYEIYSFNQGRPIIKVSTPTDPLTELPVLLNTYEIHGGYVAKLYRNTITSTTGIMASYYNQDGSTRNYRFNYVLP